MSKKISSNPSVVKIAHAARVLGVHKDTLRRWEKAGKIQVKRDQKGTRLYDISDLVNIIPGDEPATASPVKTSYPPTADLLKSAQIHLQNIFVPPRRPLGGLDLVLEDNKNSKKNLYFVAGLSLLVFLAVAGIGIYLRTTHIPYSKPTQQKNLLEDKVLGQTTSQATVKINANEKVTGSLTVDSDINGMKLVVSPVRGDGLSISANEATISASGSINLNQDVSTTASPTFAGLNVPSLTSAALNLTSTSKQVVFQSGGPTGTLTWTPTAAKTITLPDTTDTLVGKTTTDTLSNKTIKSGDSNTVSGSFTGITGLGTITTGTWNATKIGIGYGGTGLTSFTTGDILYTSASDTLSKLTIGSSGQVLKVSSGLPAWGAASACTNCLVTDPSSTQTITPTSSSAIGLSIAQASGGTVDIFDVTNNGGTAKYFSVNSSGNVGIGTSAAGAALQVNGGGLFGWGTTSTAGPTNGLAVSGNVGLGTTSPSVMLDVRGSTIIAPTSAGVALRVNAAPSGSNNIFEVLNNAGTSTYFSVDSSGQLTGSAFQITDANNAIVGTAIAGGWTMNSNTFTYRRTITVTNSSGSTIPKYYVISITMNNSDSNQTYGKSQQSSPYKDFRTAWDNGGGTITEIARNVSSFTSSDITFSFQLSADISNGSSDTYYIYYGNSSLSSTPSTYTGNTQLDSADSVSNWTSGDDGYALSQETTIKQEGTGSVKAVAAIGNLGTGSTASQGQLPQTLTGQSVAKATISSTDYAYVLGGNNGTSDQTTVYKSTLSSGNIGTFSTASQGQLPQALSSLSAVSVITASPLSGYSYKKQLTITASTDALSSGYSVSLTFNHATLVTAGKSLSSGDDIRVVYYNGSSYTEIDRVLDDSSSWNNASTQIWFKTQAAISASGSDSNYYLYYGNASAANPPTNKSNIWAFWDDFDDGSYSSAWTVTAGSWSESGTTLTGTTANSYIDTSSFTLGDGEYTVKAKTTNLALGLYPVNIDDNNYSSVNPHNNGNLYNGLFRSGSNLVTNPCSTWSWDSSFHTFKLITYQNVWKVYLDGTLKCDLTPTYTNYSSAKTRLYSENGAAFDWIKVRKYVATDSSISVSAGNEDSSGSQNLFVLGGSNGGTAQLTVYKSSFDGSANLGTFATTDQSQLPQALYGHSASTFTISSTPYIYVIGGNAGTEASRNVQTTVYKSTIDSSGNVGTFSTTSQTQLSSALYYHGSTTATIGGTNYIYILGGLNSSGTAQTTVYKATVDGSANVSAITSSGQGALPAALSQLQAVVVTTGSDNYIYAIGGKNSSGNAVSTVYKAALDGSGNVGSWSSTGQGALPQALYGHGAFTASSGGTNYVYVLGGQNTAVRDTVYKAQVNDMSSYTATKTLSSTNLSNKNDLQWKYYSSATGSYMALEFSEDGSTWQTCSFSVSSASTWETKTCDISAIASASRDGVTKVRFRVTSNQTSAVTSYFDDIQAVTEYTSYTNTTSYGRSILGASNLAINAQGTGLVTVNYAATPAAAAGSGGFVVYDGTTNALFTVGGSGNVGIGTTGPARLNIIGTGTSTALTLLTQGSGSGATFGLGVLDNGNVGIGTTSSLGKLVILGGNVGIGTSSPNATLSIQGNLGIGYTGLNQAIPSNGLAVSGNVGIGTTTANSKLSIAGNAHIGSIRQGISAPTDGLLVDGNVGIGATTSSNKLDVWGNTRMTGTLTVDSTASFGGNLTLAGNLLPSLDDTFDLGSNTQRWNNLYLGPATLHIGTSTSDEYTLSYDTTNNRLGFNVNGSGPAEIVMDSSGNLGIGTTNPGSALTVIGNVGIGTSTTGASLSVNGNAVIGWGTTSTAGPASGLAVFGNVGIGTTSPTALLQIQGSGSLPSLLVTSSGNMGIGTSVTSNPLTVGIDGGTGNGAYLTTGGVWTNGSSVEFKENFVSLNDAEILNKINQLPILQWNYKLEDPSIKHIGPMAEDFYAIFGVGNDSKHISTIDPTGVALAGIKALTAQQASMSAILANLSISDDGTLNVPKLKAGSIILDPSIASASGQLTVDSSSVELSGLASNTPGVGSDSPGVSQDTIYYDLTGKIASLEERIAELENKLASQGDALEVQEEATASATASVQVTVDSEQQESTSSASISNCTLYPETCTLNLTPPDILLATGSATLANLKVTSEATFSGMLIAYEETIQQTFKSLGQTLLGTTTIAGDLTIDGTLSLTGNSVNSIDCHSGLSRIDSGVADAPQNDKCGILYIQNSSLAQGVDFFNGLVTITSDGQITAQKIQSDKLILGGGVLGSNTIKTGTDEVMVETPAVSEKSKIFVTAQTEIEIPLFVADKIIGQSFKVKTKVPALSDIIFDWSILDSP